ncbi:MAG: efflux RND transporter periplasmic adaptor subunit [Anaerolineae bacterium]
MRNLVVGVLILALLGGGYWAYRAVMGQRPANTALVRRGAITARVEAMGMVRAAREAHLSLKMGGTVQRIFVQVGERVEEGQVLLTLDTSELERKVREAELNLEVQKLQLAEVRAGPSDAEIEIAKANLRRATVAREAAQAAYDEITDEEDAATSPEAVALEQAKTDYERARAEFERAVEGATPEEIELLEKQVALAEVALEEAKARLAEAQIIAPFAGTVTAIEVREGENVGALVPLITLSDLTTLEILAQIDEIDVAEVAVGQRVQIRLDAFPGQELTGTIIRVAPAATTERGSTIYQAVVEFEETDLPLKLGMGANLRITTLEKTDVLLVPNRAIQPIGRKKVVRVLEGSRVREVEVVTGLSNESETEIVEGLREGEVVLVE